MAKAYRSRIYFVLLGIFFTLILGIILTILPIPFLFNKACASVDTTEKALVVRIIQIQKYFHERHGKFSGSLKEIELFYPGFLDDLKVASSHVPLEKWNIKVLAKSTMVDIFIIPTDKQYGKYALYSEIARVQYNRNDKEYKRLICRSINPGILDSANINLNSAGESKCPLDTREDC